MPASLVHIAMTLALAESVGLALLLLRVRGVRGMPLLVVFLLGVAAWILNCELPLWFGPGAQRVSVALVAFSSLTSSVFLHFVLVLCEIPKPQAAIRWGYAVGGGATLIALILPAGTYGPWLAFDAYFLPNAIGWFVGIVWALLAAAGHAVMAWCWWQRRGPPRGQLVAMCMASGWGALCMSGYAFRAMGFDLYPFPLLLLPVYPLILVYGILRYRLMIVNAWARRALAWTLLVGLGSAAVIGLAALPLPFNEPVSGWRLWLVAVVTLLAAGLLLDPFRRFATRLVYPGSNLAEDAVEGWRNRLAAASSHETLAATASAAISGQLDVPVHVVVGGAGGATMAAGVPTLVCRPVDGRWRTTLAGWDAAPPGPRYAAQLFGTVVAEAAGRLEQAMAFARAERERARQERLAELGQLAATVAHDIRNPLNVIVMAAAMAPPDVRQEIATQTARISQLAADLLDYAKSWQVEKQPLDLSDHVRVAVARYPEVSMGPGLALPVMVDADPRRLAQALLNVVENARAALPAAGDRRIQIDAHRAGPNVELLVCDTGAGVPAEIRDTLFQPFVSRRAGGTGLGLAIVAKILQAHGGSARLDARDGWRTCFVLSLPASTTP